MKRMVIPIILVSMLTFALIGCASYEGEILCGLFLLKSAKIALYY